jgi:hypothetical protein
MAFPRKVLNPTLADELVVINSVHGDIAVPTYSDDDHTTVEVRLPQDDHTYHVRFPSAYPSEYPVITGVDPLHLSTREDIASELCYFRACLIVHHTPGEGSFYEIIAAFDSIRQLYRQLSGDQAGTLCQRDDPLVQSLQEQLSALVEAVQTAMPDNKNTLIGQTLQISECSVCLEPLFTRFAAVLPDCSDAYCSACLQLGIKTSLETRTLFKCCGKPVPVKTIERFGNLDPAALRYYADMINEKAGQNPVFCHDRYCSTYIPSTCITEKGASCPMCGLLTCPSCRKTMHEGICVRDMKRLWNMAKRQGWKTCPGCKQWVERSAGCKSMVCTCGQVFCYNCGKAAPKGTYHIAGDCCLNGELFDTMRPRHRQ